MFSKTETATAPGVNYEGASLVEVTVGEADYRVDAGKQGTAFSISSRPTGTWDWTFGGEARWDGTALRSRTYERSVLTKLSTALASALADIE